MKWHSFFYEKKKYRSVSHILIYFAHILLHNMLLGLYLEIKEIS